MTVRYEEVGLTSELHVRFALPMRVTVLSDVTSCSWVGT
jgi:hypothetical protein